jgi:hypothetical protein
MIKVVACTSSSDELARFVAAPVFVDVCSAVTELIAAVETQRQERVTNVTVLDVRAPESTSFQAPVLVNIGGKIMHFALPQVHAPAALASVQRQVNAFGVFFSVFTSATNFHTSSTRSATLFRGGSSRAAVLDAIEHVFLPHGVAEVLLNNVVFSGRLGHPVSPKNAAIRRALEAVGAGRVEIGLQTEDSMFVHSFVVRATDRAWLSAREVQDLPDLCVRINVGRTGVVNFFFGIQGGVVLASAAEERLQSVCMELFEHVRRVV